MHIPLSPTGGGSAGNWRIQGMYQLQIEAHFCAAHRLREYNGECERLHGHNWRVRVTVESERLDRLGMAVDFRELKRLLGEVVGGMDHAYLNELEGFAEQNPTTENIARLIYERLAAKLPEEISLAEVTAWESPGCSATYRV